MMDAAQLRDFIRAHFTRTAFRLETLQQYEVASDGNDFGRYLAGHPAPTPQRKEPWLARLRDEHARGLRRSRVRVITAPVTDYTRYECEWGYAPNSEAGEDIRILDLTDETPEPYGYVEDFWLLDDRWPISMHYDETGRFLGADIVPDALRVYRNIRDLTVLASTPFPGWWGAHPELHRENRRAA